MKTLVIHPKDTSTDFLAEIYAGKDWTIITEDISRNALEKAIKAHDRIIMMGHGDGNGLFGFGKYVINSSNVYSLREKSCVMIWCYANDFVNKHMLKGLYTGMIISEYEEAMYCCVRATSEQIKESNELFAKSIAAAIDQPNGISLILEKYDSFDNPVIHFNKHNIKFNM